MLAPEGYGEIIGGGQREDDKKKLIDAIKRHNLPLEAFQWYIDLRRYGSVPHSGFGLGIERLVNDLEALVDEEHKIVSTPAYMEGKTIKDVAEGIEKLVNEVLRLAKK